MMKKRPWRVVSVCFIIAALFWPCSGYAVCTEPPPGAPNTPGQESSANKDPGKSLHHLQVELALVPHIQSLSEDNLLTEEEPEDEDEKMELAFIEDRKQVEERAWELQELVTEPEPVIEQLILEASNAQDQEPSPTSDLPPPPSVPVSEEPSTPPSAQDSASSDIVSGDVVDDAPLREHSDAGSADCDLSSVPVVLENTSNVHGGGTKSHVEPALVQSSQDASALGSNTSHLLEEQGLSSHVPTETDPSVAPKDPEDIPTFDEWKRKMMEVEKEKIQATHTSSSGASRAVKKIQKNFNNYASVECGAKILGANPEAKSTCAILMENMDLYMLNPCSNKIWFVIELCEPIQVKRLDIANFELFSSTPKDFLVSISDRYPTNKWLKLGTFHGRDERTVQSFPLDEHLYAKYVKVELLSHFGSEHFCPLSLIRVFGTSMVEEYEEIAEPSERPDDQDDYFDYPPGYVPQEAKSSNNLIGSATDVLLNMVNNIADVLGAGATLDGNFTGQTVNVTDSSISSQLDPEVILTPVPDIKELDQRVIQVDPDAPVPESPAVDPLVPEEPPTEPPQLEPPPEGDMVVTWMEEEEADPPQPTITLLDREEEEEDEERTKERERAKQESQDYCGLSSSCSSSIQEYLHQRCLALSAPRRNPGETERTPEPPPHTYTPAWLLPLTPPVSDTPKQPASQEPQPEEAPLEQGDGGAGSTEAPQPPAEQGEARPEPAQLEPSLAGTSCSDTPASKPTLGLEMPQTSTLDVQALLERGQEGQVEGRPTPTMSTSSSRAPEDQTWGPPTEEMPVPEGADLQEPEAPPHPLDVADPSPPPLPAVPPQAEPPAPPSEPDSGNSPPEDSLPDSDLTASPHTHTAPPETKGEDPVDDILLTSPHGSGQPPRPSPSSHTPSHSEFYAEQHDVTEKTGSQVHGSGQKESVFMRLNNRIKALEMNMSLSGRYLEQLSQRYRKQMEEMQRAFNMTVIKLQNTSRIAEEQDQRQTESIQTLQGQLENITRLVLNLSVSVLQLQSEVSDRQSYLLLCLVLCLLLGLLLCSHHCRISSLPPSPTTDPEPPSYSSPDRSFSSRDDTSFKRRASYPLLLSDSCQLASTEGPESLHMMEPPTFVPANKKKKRGKVKPSEKAETLKPSTVVISPPVANGAPICNGAPRGANLSRPLLLDSPSEGSSEGSSHSDEPSFCGIATCTRLCDDLPPPKSRAERRAERRAFKHRRSRPGCVVVDLLQAPRMDTRDTTPTLQDLMRGNKELRSGTFGVTAL
ncbi:SUN domain-containing ossification factor isoform X2 [Hypomesus transpacificus]|uniref:SUN domain-containing ossification factor isoform X2 n=1 Tax=Hypomesus transpacificus TaxID=137520 RepID=UPI001F0737FB|nr:SUN domain-containing ossification factor isoform X2 [Hypomesus transpacificus]